MNKIRLKNQIIGWAETLFIWVCMAWIGYGAYKLFDTFIMQPIRDLH